MTNRVLRGDRCKCSACGLHFNSTLAFDKHRTGAYGHGDKSTRRCRTPAEMEEAGMGKTVDRRDGSEWWVTETRAQRAARGNGGGQPVAGVLAEIASPTIAARG